MMVEKVEEILVRSFDSNGRMAKCRLSVLYGIAPAKVANRFTISAETRLAGEIWDTPTVQISGLESFKYDDLGDLTELVREVVNTLKEEVEKYGASNSREA